MSALGKVIGETSAYYHSQDAVSHSKLEVFRKSRRLYHLTHVKHAIQREETAALVIGSAFHCEVLEPATFGRRYAVMPESMERRSAAGKAAYAAFVSAHIDQTILDAGDLELVRKMAVGVRSNGTAATLLDKGEPEVSWRVQPNALPFLCQCRTDWFNLEGCELSQGRPYVADLKTVDTSRSGNLARAFGYAARQFGYGRQAGFYVPLLQGCGVDVHDFFFIAVEKSEPFACEVYRLSGEKLLQGLNQTEQDLLALAECVKTDTWPNGREGIQEIDWFERDDAA